jgi:hypothetical protein
MTLKMLAPLVLITEEVRVEGPAIEVADKVEAAGVEDATYIWVVIHQSSGANCQKKISRRSTMVDKSQPLKETHSSQ